MFLTLGFVKVAQLCLTAKINKSPETSQSAALKFCSKTRVYRKMNVYVFFYFLS